MKRYWLGLDVLRGIGIFMVIILHTAFYYYDGIYDVDLDNPTPLITLIGLLLMFAGLFAMISGLVHTWTYRAHQIDRPNEKRIRYMLANGGILLIIAYLYFIFTGPGLIHFDTRSMDESLLVSLFNQGRFQPLTMVRVFYVDSLVMLALNIILLAAVFKVIGKWLARDRMPLYWLIGATLFMALSYIRIPLYDHYLAAWDEGRMLTVLVLNWLVAKNNPILPFFAFALFGAWLALLLERYDFKGVCKRVVPVALLAILIGVAGYVLSPETMLERAIDPTWYFIMVAQIGLFMLLIMLAVWIMDINKKRHGVLTRFLTRFGVAGLTPFFFESLLSAFLFFLMTRVMNLTLSIPGALLYGLILALGWGFFLSWWQERSYRHGLEWLQAKLLSKLGHSSKRLKLRGVVDDPKPD